MRTVLHDQRIRELLASPDLLAALRRDAVMRVLDTNLVRQLSDPGLLRSLQSQELMRQIASRDLQAALAVDSFAELLRNSELRAWLAQPGVAAALASRDLQLALVALPLVLVSVFERSERATRDWVGTGLDLDLELLHLMTSEHVHGIRVGRYLRELRARFDGAVVADMFCLLRIDLELAIQAKARLVAREAGVEVPVDSDLRQALAERDYLRRSVGATGLLALEPARHVVPRRLAPLPMGAVGRPNLTLFESRGAALEAAKKHVGRVYCSPDESRSR